MVNKWTDVTFGMYIELVQTMDGMDMDNEDNLVELISILLDKDVEVVKELSYDKFLKHSNKLAFMNTPIPKAVSNKVTVDGVDMELMNFYKLEFGAFIDIENLLADEYLHNLPKIFSILYRQVEKPSTALSKATYEPYGDWLDIRDVLFENVPLTALYGVIDDYLVFREMIQKSYEGLFQEAEEDFNQIEEDELVKGMSSKEREAYEQEKSVAKYGWDLMLLRLAHNEPLKMMDAAGMPTIMALNVLGMMQQLKIA